MKISLETLRNYTLRAKDGSIGKVRDILIEEDQWTARWIVADTGDWLLGRKVLLSPLAFEAPDHDKEEIPVNLRKDQIESAPSLSSDAPVSHDYEKSYFDHYQWPYYWMGGALWGDMNNTQSINPLPTEENLDLDEPEPVEERDVVLRSGHEMSAYRLRCGEKVFGYVEDVAFDTDDWSVTYFQCDTRKWWHGKTMRISPEKVVRADWPDHSIHVDISSEELEHASQESREGDPPIHAQIRAIFGIPSSHSED